jgi:predicted ATP-binding protein involved in virulence
MSDPDLLRVNKILVVKLFGIYTHEVPLRIQDRVTIIHGPNGVGKTVLFRLVAAMLSGNVLALLKVPFETFEVTLSNGSILGFTRTESPTGQKKEKDAVLGTCYLKVDGKEVHQFQPKASQVDIRRLAFRIEREMPWISRIDEDRFIDRRTDEVFTGSEFLMNYSGRFPERWKGVNLFPESDWLLDIRSRVNVHLVEAQRLLRVSPVSAEWEPQHRRDIRDTYSATVKAYAKDLQGRISETLTLYAKQSQSLDQSFPQRLLMSTAKALSVDDLKTRMGELEADRNQLKRIRLIDEDAAYPFDVRALDKLDDTRRTVMTLYVEDTARKLGVLADFAKRIEILVENINGKFTHKKILIDRDKGLVLRTDDGQTLELDALSSGEQHELVLLYDLLFRVKPNTLVLIDEPELSLHVNWQKSFLPDLIKVVEATGYDVILATHSPFIVGDRSDLMVALTVGSDVQESAK